MDQSLRVTLISGSMPEMTCGVAEYTARLAEALTATGVAVRVVTSIDPAVRPGRGYPVIGVTGGWGLRELPRILRGVLAAHPDVVHVQYPSTGYRHGLAPGLLLPVVRVLAPRTRLVATLHEYRHLHPLHRLYVAATMPWAHVIVTPDRTQIAGIPLLRHRTVAEIPLASNLQPSADPGPREPPSSGHGDELVVGTWGLLREDKGIDLAIDAFEAVAAQRPTRLVIAGDPGADGAYIARIERRIAASPVAHRISRTGRLSGTALFALLRTWDACLLPYRAGLEANRGTYAGAVASGVYVITTSPTRRGYDAVTNTIFVPPCDVPSLVNAVLDARNHPHVAPKDAAYGWRVISATHVRLYGGRTPAR